MEIDIEKAKQEFKKYTEKYNFENPKIKRKFGHSYRVMDIAGKIAESLNMSLEEIQISKLIGLLHDIGRFEQIRIYDTFIDHKSIDHGDLGAEILRKDNYIRKYIEEEKYDKIILKAIKNHNKFVIEDGLTEKELLFAKIVRDADKLDIFYEGVEMFWIAEKEQEEIGESLITPKVFEQFNSHSIIDRKQVITPADEIISFVGLIYDINFKYDYEVLLKEKYIDKVLDKFKFKDVNTAGQIDKARTIVSKYIESKI